MIRQRAKEIYCGIWGGLFLAFLFFAGPGIAGGIDAGTISMGAGMTILFAALAAFAVTAPREEF